MCVCVCAGFILEVEKGWGPEEGGGVGCTGAGRVSAGRGQGGGFGAKFSVSGLKFPTSESLS